ncbi:penicillin-binding protein activator [Erythrobacteraceae bacterium CFH 75059]|nr:penicillin-binding protein activator [Erythrobacteraceae bacterium CFH 75059]
MLAAGCAVVPRTSVPAPAERAPVPLPSASVLPSDQGRHRIALLVPLSGPEAGVGQALVNATQMATIDTGAQTLRITSYDTAAEGGAAAAASTALQDGNVLILGPLFGDEVGPVVSVARSRDVPVISFSNDAARGGTGAFIMGTGPEQSVERSVRWARQQGTTSFAALVPEGEYGERAEAAFRSSVAAAGGTLTGVERFARNNTSIVSAARRLRSANRLQAVFIADTPERAGRASRELGTGVQIIGNELWSGDASVANNPALRGAIFSAVSDARYRQFVDSYRARFGAAPYRIATLGYDAVLLALAVGDDWRFGRPFPQRSLADPAGFLGLDGAFRFDRRGTAQRMLEVRQVRAGQVTVVDPAPARFAN